MLQTVNCAACVGCVFVCVACRVLRAAQDAISSSLLEVSIDSATGVLFNVTGPLDLGLAEVRVREADVCTGQQYMQAEKCVCGWVWGSQMVGCWRQGVLGSTCA
jgi:hypothetical protein